MCLKLEVFLDWQGATGGLYKDVFTIATPLRKLTWKNVSFVWSYQYEDNFQELKKRLTMEKWSFMGDVIERS